MSISLAILWHMHQPYYFDPFKNKFMLPWVRLHATKDYLDMLLILKEFPEINVSFNLVPSLIKQIKEYENGVTDIFLDYSLIPAEELSSEQKVFIIENFFLANWKTMVYPFPRYRELLDKRGKTYADPEKLCKKFSSQDIRDLQVLFNLTWIDPLHRNRDPFLKELVKKGCDYTEEEKKLLIDKHLEIMKQIIPAYKEMAMAGQIEITTTPFYHPILPLLCNNFIAKESMPGISLPENNFRASEDALTQIKKAIIYFEEIFGFKPKGMWPSEGSVSEEVLRLFSDVKIQWIATDEEILSNSLGEPLRKGEKLLAPEKLYQPYEFEGVKIFFRDRILSDMIGFVYSNWQPDKAVNDFLTRIRSVSISSGIIPVILDGENAWEYYENDGLDFLRKLYESLAKSNDIKTVIFSEYLNENPISKKLNRIFPGSWIGANFSVWIGHEEDNLSWDYLYKARQELISFQRDNPDKTITQAWESLYIAEGSDWNWWYGDEHYTETKDIFDELYRHHLMNIYYNIGKEPPSFLFVPISKKMREIKPEIEPKGFIYPKIDGRITGYFEWLEAGRFNLSKMGGSMHKSEGLMSYLYYGFNKMSLFLRIDPYRSIEDFKELKIQIHIIEPKRIKILCDDLKINRAEIFIEVEGKWIKIDEIETIAVDEIFEIELPFQILSIKEEEDIFLFIEILKNGYTVDRAPHMGFIKIHVPTPDFDKLMWL